MEHISYRGSAIVGKSELVVGGMVVFWSSLRCDAAIGACATLGKRDSRGRVEACAAVVFAALYSLGLVLAAFMWYSKIPFILH